MVVVMAVVVLGACGLVRTQAFTWVQLGANAGSEQRGQSLRPRDGKSKDHSPRSNPAEISRSQQGHPRPSVSATCVGKPFSKDKTSPKEDKLLSIYILPCWCLHIYNKMISVARNGAVALKDKLV